MPRGRAISRNAVPRRKRVWARQDLTISGIASGVPGQVDVLTSIEFSGATQIGWTVGPVILSGLSLRRTSATVTTSATVVLGVRVGSSLVDAGDQSPVDLPMLDWMLWQAIPTPDTTNTATQLQDLRTGSMRKLEEVNDTLWIVAHTSDTGTYTLDCWVSTLIILP